MPTLRGVNAEMKVRNDRDGAIEPSRRRWSRLGVGLLLAPAILIGTGGCASEPTAAKVIFLDGAGHFGAGSSVQSGLRKAGYRGGFEEFVWTSFLLWGADHLFAARSGENAERLARQITEFRQAEPEGYLTVMSLSAGSSVALSALERLPDDVQVDYLVLFQPSVSSKRNLAPALRHVKRRLYATASQRDAILATMLVTADGRAETPAGRYGFQCPPGVSRAERAQYSKVRNLRWHSKYDQLGWDGGHTSSTDSKFVKYVIAPRMRGKAVYKMHTPPPDART